MRADQWLMLGVVGLGAYAVYRMSRASGASSSPEALPEPALPSSPGTLALPPDLAFAATPAGPSLHLSNSRAYLGRGERVSQGALEALGFENVRVWTGPNAAQRAGFPAFAVAKPGAQTRWFYGRYLRATRDVPRALPDGSTVDVAWIVRGPDAVSGVPAFAGGW